MGINLGVLLQGPSRSLARRADLMIAEKLRQEEEMRRRREQERVWAEQERVREETNLQELLRSAAMVGETPQPGALPAELLALISGAKREEIDLQRDIAAEEREANRIQRQLTGEQIRTNTEATRLNIDRYDPEHEEQMKRLDALRMQADIDRLRRDPNAEYEGKQSGAAWKGKDGFAVRQVWRNGQLVTEHIPGLDGKPVPWNLYKEGLFPPVETPSTEVRFRGETIRKYAQNLEEDWIDTAATNLMKSQPDKYKSRPAAEKQARREAEGLRPRFEQRAKEEMNRYFEMARELPGPVYREGFSVSPGNEDYPVSDEAKKYLEEELGVIITETAAGKNYDRE